MRKDSPGARILQFRLCGHSSLYQLESASKINAGLQPQMNMKRTQAVRADACHLASALCVFHENKHGLVQLH